MTQVLESLTFHRMRAEIHNALTGDVAYEVIFIFVSKCYREAKKMSAAAPKSSDIKAAESPDNKLVLRQCRQSSQVLLSINVR
jgi:hypothetical protein